MAAVGVTDWIERKEAAARQIFLHKRVVYSCCSPFAGQQGTMAQVYA